MPCHSAMIKNVLLVEQEDVIEKILKNMKKKKASLAVVLDDEGDMVGYLDMPVLLKNLLPVSLSMQVPGLGSGDMVIGAAPGIAKRLRKVKPLEVNAIMNRDFHTIAPETPVWEGVQALVEYGGPIFVTEAGTKRYVGVIDEVSALDELERLQEAQGGADNE